MCIAWIYLSSSEEQPEAGSSGSTKPVLIQRSSPLMFQHLQLSHTQQSTLEGLFLLALNINAVHETILSYIATTSFLSFTILKLIVKIAIFIERNYTILNCQNVFQSTSMPSKILKTQHIYSSSKIFTDSYKKFTLSTSSVQVWHLEISTVMWSLLLFMTRHSGPLLLVRFVM